MVFFGTGRFWEREFVFPHASVLKKPNLKTDEKYPGFFGLKAKLFSLLEEIGETDPFNAHITTDSGSSMLKATQGMNHYKCACHRLNTFIENAWAEFKCNISVISELDAAVSAVVTNVQHKADIQRNLNCKIPGN